MSEQSFDAIRDRLDEISKDMLNKASDKSDDLFFYVRIAFDNFSDVLDDTIDNNESNPYLNKIKELSDEIYEILQKKGKQGKKFFKATRLGV